MAPSSARTEGSASLWEPRSSNKYCQELRATLADPEVRAKLTQLGLEPVGSSAAEFAAFVQSEMDRAAQVVKVRGIKVD